MRSYVYAVAFITPFVLAAHLVVPEPYLWYRNSISQLAAQAYGQAWIMRAGFVGFGLLLQVAGIARIRAAPRYWYREALVMLYGLGVLLSGIFSTSPFKEGVPYSREEARLHTVLATTAGIGLAAVTLLFALTDVPSSRRLVHSIALLLITAVSFLFNALPALSGAIQRVLWIIGFAWLIYLGSNVTGSTEPEDSASSA